MTDLHKLDEQRGHSLVPTPEELESIPRLYATDDIPLRETVVHLHYFVAGADWYVAEIDPETWAMFAHCDLGLGFPEWGYVSLAELADLCVRTPQGFPLYVERDRHFSARPWFEVEDRR